MIPVVRHRHCVFVVELVTLAVVPNTAPAKYGGLAVDADGRVTGTVRRGAGQPSPFPKGMIEIAIPDSNHHIMVDQPLALVAALRALLAAWPA